jgi:hypothetical protein
MLTVYVSVDPTTPVLGDAVFVTSTSAGGSPSLTRVAKPSEAPPKPATSSFSGRSSESVRPTTTASPEGVRARAAPESSALPPM